VWTLAAVLRNQPLVKRVFGYLDECVRHALFEFTRVTCSIAAG
jgi:hypothetical protein